MTEVSVVFPSRGNIDVQHRESVEANQGLSWKIQSFNPQVKKVKIRFELEADGFFQTNSGVSHESPERLMAYSGDKGNEFAMATIYGCAPDEDKTRAAKYSVIGIVDGEDIVLDPEIVIHPEPNVVQSSISVDP